MDLIFPGGGFMGNSMFTIPLKKPITTSTPKLAWFLSFVNDWKCVHDTRHAAKRLYIWYWFLLCVLQTVLRPVLRQIDQLQIMSTHRGALTVFGINLYLTRCSPEAEAWMKSSSGFWVNQRGSTGVKDSHSSPRRRLESWRHYEVGDSDSHFSLLFSRKWQ